MLTVRPIPESEIAMHESALDEFARTLEVNTGIELGPPKKPVVLAFEDDVIVGCLWSTAEPPFDLDVGVDKQFRRQGILYKMIYEWLMLPSIMLLADIDILVTAANPITQQMLQRVGIVSSGSNTYVGRVKRAQMLKLVAP